MASILRNVSLSEPRWRSADEICGRIGILLHKGGNIYGHCIRLSPQWILTAHHVLNDPDFAAEFTAQRFGYLAQNQSPGRPPYQLAPYKNTGWFCSKDGNAGMGGDGFDLDYALVRLVVPNDDPPFSVEVTANKTPPKIGSEVYVPQFNTYPWSPTPYPCEPNQEPPGPMPFKTVPTFLEPVRREVSPCKPDLLPNCSESGSFPLKWILDTLKGRRPCTITAIQDEYLYHLAYTDDGCSGAPMFNSKNELIGLHTHAWDCKHTDDLQKVNNWGTSIAAIVADAKSQKFPYFHEIPCLEALK